MPHHNLKPCHGALTLTDNFSHVYYYLGKSLILQRLCKESIRAAFFVESAKYQPLSPQIPCSSCH